MIKPILIGQVYSKSVVNKQIHYLIQGTSEVEQSKHKFDILFWSNCKEN